MSSALPPVLPTPRFLLRAWSAADAPALLETLAASAEHLRAWTPWVLDESSPLAVVEARLARYAADFAAGGPWLYGIFASAGGASTLCGGCGLYPRVGPGALEIGYWVAAGHTGRGVATEAAAALGAAALALDGVERVEIRCDARNLASIAVPRRLGYVHVGTHREEATPTRPACDLTVWERRRTSPAARAE